MTPKAPSLSPFEAMIAAKRELRDLDRRRVQEGLSAAEEDRAEECRRVIAVVEGREEAENPPPPPSLAELRTTFSQMEADAAREVHEEAEAARDRARHAWATTREAAARRLRDRLDAQVRELATSGRFDAFGLGDLFAAISKTTDDAVRKRIEELPDRALARRSPDHPTNAAMSKVSREIARLEEQERRSARLRRGSGEAEKAARPTGPTGVS